MRKDPTSRANSKSADEPAAEPTDRDSAGHSEAAPTSTAARETPRPRPTDFPIVGIGASAGGLEAFRRFFTAMPPDCGMAFVLIQHLDPKHESRIDLLSSYTKQVPVVKIEEGMTVEANRIYMIPANRYVTLVDGKLHLSRPGGARGPRMAIDCCFRSIAEVQQEKAICIVLTGTGSDGTAGLKAVKEHGGMTMVQDPATAQHDGMPRSAISTGLADFVLPIEEMPNVLLKYARHAYVRTVPLVDKSPDSVNTVLSIIQSHLNFDFRNYKRSTLIRRIERRMGLRHTENISDYVELLRADPDEIRRLYRDLLIGVTSFFRDPEAYKTLEEIVLPALLKEKRAGGIVRVWVPGCSSGEEAYSIAMLLFEQLDRMGKRLDLKIFATDVDEHTLASARAGRFPAGVNADISSDRINRFFNIHHDDTYEIKKSIREAIVFAPQNLVSDPPFSRLDLISCRNLMIYLNADVQKQLISLFHFSLRLGGYLFLGTSESVAPRDDMFETVSKKWRIYRRIGPVRPERLAKPRLHASYQDHERQEQARTLRPPRETSIADLARRALLEEFAPASVVVNRKYQVLYFHGAISRFLDIPGGEPTHELLEMLQEDLRSRLRGALHKAIREDAAFSFAGKITRNGDVHSVRVSVKPIHMNHGADVFLLVSFEQEPEAKTPSVTEKEPRQKDHDNLVRELEDELRGTKEDLQGTLEELESSNEELKASNEEVISMNEELQSTNEELQTSQEELQSVNEELSTVNAQLKEKIEELEDANNDLSNFLANSDVATVFLDTDFHIRRFTPATTRILNVISSDVGRPISDISNRLIDPDLITDARTVIERLTAVEKEVQTQERRWYLRRIGPYRTHDNRIDGVVLTFTDITRLKNAVDQLETRTQYQTAVAEFGQLALTGGELQVLFERAVDNLAGVFKADYCNLLELQPEGKSLLLRAGVGWKEGLVGKAAVGAGPDSQSGYALQSKQAVIVENLAEDKRFRGPQLLTDHNVVSGMTVIVGEPDKPFGVLGVHAKSRRSFSKDDVSFIQSFANVLGQAIERRRSEDTLRTLTGELEERVLQRTELVEMLHDVATAANEAVSFEGALEYIIARVAQFNGWSFGHAYLPVDDDPEELFVAETYYAESPERFRRFREITVRMRLRRGEGLPGRVFESGDAEWAENLRQELMDRRAEVCAELGIESAAAFPILVGDETAGVLEFFSEKPIHDSARIRDSMSGVGTLLGRVLERQRAERELRESEHRFRSVFENPAIGIVLADAEGKGRILQVNKSFCQMLGYERDELIGRNIADITHPEDVERGRVMYESLVSGQVRVKRLEKRYLRKDRQILWGSLTTSMLRDAHREPIAVIKLIWDNTERKKAEAELREIRVSLEQTTEGIAQLDGQGRYVNVNRPFAAMFGYEPSELIGQAWERTAPEQDYPLFRQALVRMLSTGRAEWESRGLRKDGSTFNIRVVLWRASEELSTGHYCFVTDVSERKALEKEVADLSIREQRRIAQDLHDNLGQQVTGIAMLATSLQGELEARSSPEARKAERIVQGIREAQRQLRDLLKGLMPVEIDPIGLAGALAGLVDRYQDHFGGNGRFESDDGIVVGDDFTATNLYYIAQEALHNAAKHSGARQMVVALRRSGDGFKLTVRDDGRGSEKLGEEAEGIGLRIMRYRAGLIGAKLEIKSKEQDGTSVICTLSEEKTHGGGDETKQGDG